MPKQINPVPKIKNAIIFILSFHKIAFRALQFFYFPLFSSIIPYRIKKTPASRHFQNHKGFIQFNFSIST